MLPSGGRPKGSGATFVRIEEPRGQQATWRIHIGRALWQQLGEFSKVRLSRVAGVLTLTPAARGDASFGVYVVSQPTNGMPRLSLGRETVEALALVAGRHAATLVDGAIRVREVVHHAAE
jgi:hypothetical protein